MAKALSDQEYRERERSVHTAEDKILAFMLENENASLADTAKAVMGNENKKSAVWRILQNLEKSKLVRKVRGKYDLTKEGEKAAKRIGTTDDDAE
jgi:hypothetical protein